MFMFSNELQKCAAVTVSYGYYGQDVTVKESGYCSEFDNYKFLYLG